MKKKLPPPPKKEGINWKKEGYRTFELFSKDWKKYYKSLEEYYFKEFDSSYFNFSKIEFKIDPSETKQDIENYANYGPNEEVIQTEKTIAEWQKCAESFEYFCHKYIKIAHPKRGLMPFRLYSYQRRVIKQYEEHQFSIISKFRQGGLTTVSVLWGLWRCMFKLDQTIMILSKTDREAITAGEIVSRAMEHLPKWLKPKLSKNNDHQKQFEETGGLLCFYTPEAARGKAITYLIIDEAAFIPDMRKHWKSMYPTLSTGGNCIVISTVNGVGNWYEEMYTGATEKANEFNVIDLDYWEHPDYHDEEWVRKQKANLGEKGWKQEVLRQFLGSGDTFISPEILGELMQKTTKTPPVRKLFPKFANKSELIGDGALWIWKEPIDGHEYVIGADCAECLSEDSDNSSFQIIDILTLEQVGEFYSNRIPPHVFAQILSQVGLLYNTATVVIEAMAPAGGAVLATLQHKLFYDNIYYDTNKKTVTPGIRSNQSIRPLILECISSRLIEKTFKVNSTRLVDEFKTFIYNGQKRRAEARQEKHDDAIMALGVALYAIETLSRNMPVGASAIEETPIIENSFYQEIKNELKKGAPINWLENDDDEEEKEEFNIDNLLPVAKKYVPENYKLLKEFNWWL